MLYISGIRKKAVIFTVREVRSLDYCGKFQRGHMYLQ